MFCILHSEQGLCTQNAQNVVIWWQRVEEPQKTKETDRNYRYTNFWSQVVLLYVSLMLSLNRGWCRLCRWSQEWYGAYKIMNCVVHNRPATERELTWAFMLLAMVSIHLIDHWVCQRRTGINAPLTLVAVLPVVLINSINPLELAVHVQVNIKC